MIRYNHINNLILNIYRSMPYIQFPINLQEVIRTISNCRYLSYQEFASINHCSISDVIHVCESKSGCTHYDVVHDRYLILCNQSTDGNNNLGRQLWTFGHEIGHVVCNHLSMSACDKLSENSMMQTNNIDYEVEADYFAATILAPFPLFKLLCISSSVDIQNMFGLSAEAAFYRYKHYLKWQKSRIKTSWENDIIRVYLQKKI